MSDYLQQIKILIVDDQDFIRSILRHMLGVLGARDIYDAVDGEEAWEKTFLVKPDLVIVDWEMSPVNGVEFTRRIRKDDNSPNRYIPIIMLTGHSDKARVTTARDSGINEFVTKPVAAKPLFERIANVIENPRNFVRTDSYFGPDRRRRSVEVAEERRNGKLSPVNGKPADFLPKTRSSEILSGTGLSV